MQEEARDEWLAAEDQESAPGDHEHRQETQHDPQCTIRWRGHKLPFPIGTDYTSEPTRVNPPEPWPTIQTRTLHNDAGGPNASLRVLLPRLQENIFKGAEAGQIRGR